MRYKLANGGVVATTKQPIQNRDFDRLVVTNNSTSLPDLTDSSWWPENYEWKNTRSKIQNNVEVTVKLYNPSSATIRKSYHPDNCRHLLVGPTSNGTYGKPGGHKVKHPYVGYIGHNPSGYIALNQEMNYGDVLTFTCNPHLTVLGGNYNREVNPISSRWYNKQTVEEGGRPEPTDQTVPPYDNYNYPIYSREFMVKLQDTIQRGKKSGPRRSNCDKIVNNKKFYCYFLTKSQSINTTTGDNDTGSGNDNDGNHTTIGSIDNWITTIGNISFNGSYFDNYVGGHLGDTLPGIGGNLDPTPTNPVIP